MTEQEKKMLQAKHRMEEAEARNRKKERSIRTPRLIQEGAILESVFPQAQHMELEALKVHCIIMDNISLYDWGKLRLFQVVQGELATLLGSKETLIKW